MANGSPSPALNNATRRIPKATYVPLSIPTGDSTSGRAVLKFGYIRQLNLQPGETASVKAQLATTSSNHLPWKTLQQFEGLRLPSQVPAPSVFAKIPAPSLLAFGKAVVALRQKSLAQLQQQIPGKVFHHPPGNRRRGSD
jgi:hypothetical protein